MLISLVILLNVLFVLNHKTISKKYNLYDFNELKKNNKIAKTGGLLVLSNIIFFVFYVYSFDNFFLSTKNLSVSVFLFAILMFLIGYVDDRLTLNGFLRYLIILICSIFYFRGVQDLSFKYPLDLFAFYIEEKFLLYILGAFFVVGFIFLSNILDGIDLNLSTFIITILLILLFLGSRYSTTLALLIIIMTFFSFLNYRRLSFLGDSGNNAIATLVSVLMILNLNDKIIEYKDVVLMLIIPVIDIFRVVVNRILNNRSLSASDKNHLHHYLKSYFKNKLLAPFVNCTICLLPYLIFLIINQYLISFFFGLIVYISVFLYRK